MSKINARWKMLQAGQHAAGHWEIRREVNGRQVLGVDIGWQKDRTDRIRWVLYEKGQRRREYRSLGVAKDAVRQITASQ